MFRHLQSQRVYRTRICHAIDELLGDIRNSFPRQYGESRVEQYSRGFNTIIYLPLALPLALAFYILDSMDNLKTG